MSSDTNTDDFIFKLADQLGEPTNPAAEWISFQKCPYCEDFGHKIFYVHSDSHNFKCHHCQEAGSKWKLAKTMVMELVGLDTDQRTILEIKHLAAEFLQDRLANDPVAIQCRKWLAKRGIPGDLLAGFTTGTNEVKHHLPIGFHPGDRAMLKHFKQFEFTEAQLNRAGIFLNNNDFTNCLIFIHHLRPDRIARFKARKVDSREARWLEGGGKLTGVFGLDWHTWVGHEAIGVEGEFDALSVLTYHIREHGTTTNVIALGGGKGTTSIDVLHQNGIRKLRVIPDNDEGGVDVVSASLAQCRKHGMECTVHTIPKDHEDPAEWITSGADVDIDAVKKTMFLPGKFIAQGLMEYNAKFRAFKLDTPVGIEAARQFMTEQANKLTECDLRDFVGCLPETLRLDLGDYKAKHVENEYFIGNQFVQSRLSRDLMEVETWLSPGGHLHKYSDGVFRPASEAMLRQLCRKRLGEKATKTRVMEVEAHISDMTYMEPDAINQRPDMLNLRNGMLDWNAQELTPHNPKYASTIQLPVEYKPGQDFGNVQDMLSQWVDEEDIPTLQEFLGYCLIPDTRFEKALMLVGSGANGKSCFLSWVGAMIGEDNAASVPLQDLDGHKFKRAEIFGKLINVFADLPAAGLKGSSYFKMICSGDRIDAERKGRDPFFFKPFTKLIFSANEQPQSPDDTPAYWRRWIVIEFPNTFEHGDNADDQFISKLTTDDMLSSLFNFSLAGLARLLQNRAFTIGANAQALLEDYRKANNPVTTFLSDRCKVVVGKNIERAQLFGEFMAFCLEQEYKPTTKQTFYNKVRAERVTEKTIKGKDYFADLTVLTGRVENFPPQGGEKVENFEPKNTLF